MDLLLIDIISVFLVFVVFTELLLYANWKHNINPRSEGYLHIVTDSKKWIFFFRLYIYFYIFWNFIYANFIHKTVFKFILDTYKIWYDICIYVENFFIFLMEYWVHSEMETAAFIFFLFITIFDLFNLNWLFCFDYFVITGTIYVFLQALFLISFRYAKKKYISLMLTRYLLIFFYVCFVIGSIHVYLLNFTFSRVIFAHGLILLDVGTSITRLWILFFSIICALLSKIYLKNSSNNLLELPLLFLFGTNTLLYIICFIDIFAIFILIEILSVIIIGVSALSATRASAEAVIKYFIQNTVVASISLLGIFIMYYLCKSTNLLIIRICIDSMIGKGIFKGSIRILLTLSIMLWIFSFLFKLGLFPTNFYVADIYEASSSPILLFISAAIKPIIFYFFFSKVYHILTIYNNMIAVYIFIILCVISNYVGDTVALESDKVKRFLGYSSIGQYGFLCIAASSKLAYSFVFAFLYLLVYNIMLIIIVYILIDSLNINDERSNVVFFSDLNLFLKGRKELKLALTFSLLTISGFPPLILFFYKYMLFLGLFVTSNYIYLILLMVSSCVSSAYYFRILSDIWVYDSNTNSNNNSPYLRFYYTEVNTLDSTFLSLFVPFIMLLFVLLFFYFDDMYVRSVILFFDIVFA